jgi:uncharacterized protein YaiI (UPF0178 family)
VVVVFDGSPFDLDADGVEVLFASRRGRDAADDDIVRLVEADPAPGELRIVTSDADLSRRAAERGARVMSAGSFRRMLDK